MLSFNARQAKGGSMPNEADLLRDEVKRLAATAIGAGGQILRLSDQKIAETVIRYYYRTLPAFAPRHLVDVGAYFGYLADVFLTDGWTADLFEPDPTCQQGLQRLLAAYGSRVRLFPFAADAQDRDSVTFVQNTTPGLSGLSPSPFGTTRSTFDVRTVRLGTFLVSKGISRVDFLKIDTEGNDFAVLEAHDFSRLPPALAFVEFSYFFPGQDASVLRGAISAMRSRGYSAVIFEYADDGNFKRGNWDHRLTAIDFDNEAVPNRPEAFGNILFYRDDDRHLLSTLKAIIQAIS
jgi:FkbM family methyltransferase